MTMTGIHNDLTMGELVIDGVSLHTPAWSVLDLLPLWVVVVDLQPTHGTNVYIPQAEGKRAYPRRIDETTALLAMHIIGDCDLDGTPAESPIIGLQTNLAYLGANVVTPPTAPPATRTAELTMADGSMWTGEVQVGLELGDHTNGDVNAVLAVTVPSARFTALGS